jgi:hypothetical protein
MLTGGEEAATLDPQKATSNDASTRSFLLKRILNHTESAGNDRTERKMAKL